MSRSCRVIPQPMILQGMLCKITETFAHELANPTPVAPTWSEFEWILARAVASMHGVSPLLSRTLRWQEPADWLQFLEEQRMHTAKRQERIAKLLQFVDVRMRNAGISGTALKGAALHSMGVYAIGDRPMADVDLLVLPADAAAAVLLLESLGYCQSGQNWKEWIFAPVGGCVHGTLGENSGDGIKIDLHERICERLPWRITDASKLIFPRHPQPGLNPYPSMASLMSHLLLHAAGSMTTRSLRLLQLHDLAQLSSRMTASDWDEMLASDAAGQRLWWAFPPLLLTSKYYASRIPPRVLGALAGACPYLLMRSLRHKTLHDVSCSYLWVEALPGIEWSRSMREMLEYSARRAWPAVGHAALRKQVAETQASADPGPWARLPLWRRTLLWMIARQRRPLTMHSVHAALAQGR